MSFFTHSYSFERHDIFDSLLFHWGTSTPNGGFQLDSSQCDFFIINYIHKAGNIDSHLVQGAPNFEQIVAIFTNLWARPVPQLLHHQFCRRLHQLLNLELYWNTHGCSNLHHLHLVPPEPVSYHSAARTDTFNKWLRGDKQSRRRQKKRVNLRVLSLISLGQQHKNRIHIRPICWHILQNL